MRLGGVVLCGGHSTRMGQSKALLPFGGGTMLECVISRLAVAASEIVLVAAKDQALPSLPSNCKIVCDEYPDRGPLEGLRVGLAALEPTYELAFVTACDMPLLNPQVILYLARQLGTHEAIVPIEKGHPHPLAAIYRTSLTHLAARLQNQDESSLQSLLRAADTLQLDAQKLQEIDPDLLSLRNFNTPEDYQKHSRYNL